MDHNAADVVVGAGSNLGDRRGHLEGAARLLEAQESLTLLSASPVYESPPLGPAQPDYLNAAFRIRTTLAPEGLLGVLQSIERAMGRVRRIRWGPRTLDLDILWSPVWKVEREGLRIPHPGLLERAFALRPLLDVAPDAPPSFGEALAGLPPIARVASIRLGKSASLR
ncbi:MAG: 2-amino-4-hydroxy-6-hydroxymethyldihydropteridine diphosphokinase [Myxococcota bacterium]